MSTDTILRSSGVVTTILGVINQFQAFTNLEYSALPGSTLNAKYHVLEEESAHPKYAPTLKYFGIGTKGFYNTDLEQGALPYPGDARNMDLYSPIPIRCIRLSEIDSVLSPVERQKYRMKVIRTFNDVPYVCYYLKEIEFNKTVEILKKDADGTVTPFPIDSDYFATWLSPKPPVMRDIGGSVNTNINRIIVRATGTCEITHDEIIEAVDAMHQGNLDYSRISEIGYYTGYDVKTYNGIDIDTMTSEQRAGIPESSLEYEAAYVQLAKHHCFRGVELDTKESYIKPKVTLESECCIIDSTTTSI